MGARIVVVKSDSASVVGFPDFLEDNWQTNGYDNSELTVLRCSSGTIATCSFFRKNRRSFQNILSTYNLKNVKLTIELLVGRLQH